MKWAKIHLVGIRYKMLIMTTTATSVKSDLVKGLIATAHPLLQ